MSTTFLAYQILLQSGVMKLTGCMARDMCGFTYVLCLYLILLHEVIVPLARDMCGFTYVLCLYLILLYEVIVQYNTIQ